MPPSHHTEVSTLKINPFPERNRLQLTPTFQKPNPL